MLANEALQMLERAGAIPASLLQLRHREERIVCIGGEWILHDDAAIVAFRICRRFGEGPSPVQGLPVAGTSFLLSGKECIHERAPDGPVAFTDQASRTPEQRIVCGGGGRGGLGASHVHGGHEERKQQV